MLCIYHGGCPDGFTAAWIVNNAVPDVIFHPGSYGAAPPDVTNQDVVIVDFSYPHDVLLEMCKTAKSVLVLDHHASAQRDLSATEADNLEIVFDMDRSGAMITWDNYHPYEPPALVKFVQDRDLWRFEIDHTEEFMAALKSFPFTFEDYDAINETPLDDIILEGKAILRNNRAIIHRIVDTTTRTMHIGGHDVQIVNCPYDFGSDAANILAQGHPFAGYYLDKEKGRQFGLRSDKDGLDVSVIAGMYGGGGHPHAAGFEVPWDSWLAGEGNDLGNQLAGMDSDRLRRRRIL